MTKAMMIGVVFGFFLSACAFNIRTPNGDLKCYSNHDLTSEIDWDCYPVKGAIR